MDDALLVGLLERLGDLSRDDQGLVEGDLSALQPLGEVLSLDELEDEEELPVRFLEPVDGGDAGVVERREELRLAPEGRAPGRSRDPFSAWTERPHLLTTATSGRWSGRSCPDC